MAGAKQEDAERRERERELKELLQELRRIQRARAYPELDHYDDSTSEVA
jgi:hypothetical protein